jgi:hypothetical protein
MELRGARRKSFIGNAGSKALCADCVGFVQE